MRNTSPTHRTLHWSIPILYLLPLLLSSHLPPLWSLCLVGLGGSRDGGALMCASCTSPNLTKIKWATAPCCTHWCRITKWRVIKGCDALSASASWVPLSNESPAIFSYHTFLPPLPANLPLTILLQFHFMRCWSSFWRLFFATICSCVVVYHFGGCSFYHCSNHDSFTLIFLLNYCFKHLNFGGCLLPLFLIFFFQTEWAPKLIWHQKIGGHAAGPIGFQSFPPCYVDPTVATSLGVPRKSSLHDWTYIRWS